MKSSLDQAAIRILAASLLTALPCTQSLADAPLNVYVGGSFGQGQVVTNSGGLVQGYPDRFQENHAAFKLLAGVRPISWLGAEAAYLDFGHPSGTLAEEPASASMRGVAAMGVLYLPVPIVDVFLKAGAARLQTSLSGSAIPFCPACPAQREIPVDPQPGSAPFRVDRTNVGFAGGAGVQFKWGSFAVRGEYESFTTAGVHPQLFSVGATWTFF